MIEFLLDSLYVEINRREKMSYSDSIDAIVLKHRDLLDLLLNDKMLRQKIDESISVIIQALEQGNQILFCGNGGSAADAQHLAAEFVSQFYLKRKALNAEALTVNTSSLTAISNDSDYQKVFSRQVEAKGKSGDVLVGITTSGGSQNVLNAFDAAKNIGMTNIAFVGADTDKVKDKANIIISVPSDDTPRIQEMHIMIGHIICECVEKGVEF